MRYIETPHTPSFPRKRESMPGNSRFTAYGKATSRLHSCQRTQRHFVYRGYQRSDRTHMAAPGTHRRRLHEAIPHCHAGLVRTAPHDAGRHSAGGDDQAVESELEAQVDPGGKSELEGSMARYRRTVSQP